MTTIGNVDIRAIAEEFGTPVYVYDRQQIEKNYLNLKNAFTKYYPNTDIHYSVKANSNPHILKIFKDLGCGADCSSPNEYRLVNFTGFDSKKVLYTGNYESVDDFSVIDSDDVKVNLDDINSLRKLLEVRKPGRISFRINPGIGKGGFEGITTAGTDAKFGIPYEKAYEAYKLAADSGIERFGIHMMTGSNNLEPYFFAEIVDKLMKISQDIFEKIGKKPEYFDIGGGYGVPYYDNEPELDVDLTAKVVSEVFIEKCAKYGFGNPTLVLEPGRYLTANAGYLISKVTGIKVAYKKFIGLDAGMNTLVRPSLYGAFHRTYVYGKTENAQTVNLCGQICENSDIFVKNIEFPEVVEGDLVIFKDAGAYGFSMSSPYNSRLRPPEVLVENSTTKLIRRREVLDDVLNFIPTL